MRELKFRVWSLIDKEWDNPAILEVWDSSGLFRPMYNPENYVIQQFTNLKDKNRKEIYEGDIIQYSLDFKNLKRISEIKWGNYSDGEYCQTIECWMIGGCSLSDAIYSSQFGYGPASEIEKNSIEVIGNIFENPELIK